MQKQRKRWFRFIALVLMTVLFSVIASPVAATIPAMQSNPSVTQASSNTLTDADRLDQQGRSLYTSGQFTEAATAFQQAAEAYQTQGNLLRQALSLSNLSLTYQQLGLWTEANQAIAESLQLLRNQEQETGAREQVFAQALDIQGNLQLAQGQAEAALKTWEQSTDLYQQLGDRERATASQINQAQALQALGLYRRAISTLYAASGLEQQAPIIAGTLRKSLDELKPDELQTMLQALPNSAITIAALQSLGETLRVTGNLEQAQRLLQHSLLIAQQLQLSDAIAIAQFRLGNVAYAQALSELSLSNLTPARAMELVEASRENRRLEGTEPALAFYQTTGLIVDRYQQVIENAASNTTILQAQLNQLNVLVETQRWRETQQLLPQIQRLIQSLPPNHTTIYARINLAQSLMKMGSQEAQFPMVYTVQLLTDAVQYSQTFNDKRTESYALGILGKLYEQTQQSEDAQVLTRRALSIAQANGAADIAYLWQWQLGRLLNAEGKKQDAIAAYTDAVDTLRSLRSDLVAISPDVQFSFRESVEPIHRELVSLLLESNANPTADQLERARKTIESLQLAELDNFFREACLNAREIQIDEVDRTAAVIYPIILDDRLEVILSLPQTSSASQTSERPQNLSSNTSSSQQTLSHHTTTLPKTEVESVVNNLLQFLKQVTANRRALPLAQQVYSWLVEPFEAELEASGVKTLVFVLDGVLRNIPMAVLHDGEGYLIEKYSVALTPSLQLLESRSLQSRQFSVLLAGISESRQGYRALPGVKTEIAEIQAQVSDNRVLLDQEFTNNRLQTAINAAPFPVVHLATHGQFSSRLENTYILTWNDRINVSELNSLLQTTDVNRRRPIELLVLSACTTAEGDDRAALGLAGIAVRAGARSTIATLWQFNDQAAPVLMERFYQELRGANITKAEALRRAQLSLLQNPQFDRPYYWGPVVLVGNWL